MLIIFLNTFFPNSTHFLNPLNTFFSTHFFCQHTFFQNSTFFFNPLFDFFLKLNIFSQSTFWLFFKTQHFFSIHFSTFFQNSTFFLNTVLRWSSCRPVLIAPYYEQGQCFFGTPNPRFGNIFGLKPIKNRKGVLASDLLKYWAGTGNSDGGFVSTSRSGTTNNLDGFMENYTMVWWFSCGFEFKHENIDKTGELLLTADENMQVTYLCAVIYCHFLIKKIRTCMKKKLWTLPVFWKKQAHDRWVWYINN